MGNELENDGQRFSLKRRGTNNRYTLVGDWVCEGERFGMEIEAISRMTIEGVANDRAA